MTRIEHSAFVSVHDKKYQAGSVMFGPAEGDTEAWLIVSGRVRQYDFHPNGSEITLNIYKAGSILSLTWLLGGASNSYFFAAETDTVVRTVPAQKFVEYLKSEPMAAFDILNRLSKGLDGMFLRIYANSFNDAKQRVLAHLMVAAKRFGADLGDGSYEVAITISQLSADTGMARETVSRAVAKLQKEQVITRTGKNIVIRFNQVI